MKNRIKHDEYVFWFSNLVYLQNFFYLPFIYPNIFLHSLGAFEIADPLFIFLFDKKNI